MAGRAGPAALAPRLTSHPTGRAILQSWIYVMTLDRSLLGQIRLLGTRQSGRWAALVAIWPPVYSCSLTVIARPAVRYLHSPT